MKNNKLENIIGVIVILIYLLAITFTVLIDITFAYAIESTVHNEKMPSPTIIPVATFEPVSQPSPEPTIKQTFEPTLQPTPEPTEKPALVAEPLYGKELYIFYISQIVEQYYPDVDPYIALAVMETESYYVPTVKSHAGAVGLMQVIPKYHAWRIDKYGLEDLWDPYTNIICGMDFLNELYSKHHDWSKALYGYNASMAYVNKVLTRADNLRKDGYFG